MNKLSSLITKSTNKNAYRVLVLQGGWNAEREVSLNSGHGVSSALKTLGHQVEVFDPPRDAHAITSAIHASFGGRGPEVIFNVLHGKEAEDGVIQGLLELTGIPYTFSDVSASATSMHKGLSRLLMHEVGIQCPKGQVMTLAEYAASSWSYPHIAKPLGEGSSVGVFYVTNDKEHRDAIAQWFYGAWVLVEDYIPGREVQVAIFAGRAMGAVELKFPGPIFDYEAQYTAGVTEHIVPPVLSSSISERLFTWAERAYKVVGCRGVARADFRYNPDGGEGHQVFFLEINTQPGFTDISLVPDIARFYGWSYEDVVAFVLDQALDAVKAPDSCRAPN